MRICHVLILVLMNILRLVAEEKQKKKQAAQNPEYQRLQVAASCKDKGDCPVKYEDAELKEKLTSMQYYVTQQKGTERPFSGSEWRRKEEGLYSCVVCDNPLFTSEQKYETSCGWPSFTDVIAEGKVTLNTDFSHGVKRIEAACSICNAHLGHVFDDGPKPKRVRYCINSASLSFKKHTTV